MTAAPHNDLIRVARLGLAAIAAIACVALLAAAPATADTLCSAEEDPCASENEYPVPINFEGNAPEALIKTGEFEVNCESDAFGTTTANVGPGEGLEGEVVEIAFSSCSGSCSTASEVGVPYFGFGKATTSGNGVGTISEGSGEESEGIPRIELNGCPLGITCIYGEGEVKGTVEGGSPASVTVEVPLARQPGSSAFCPTEATFIATFTAYTGGKVEHPAFFATEP